MFTHTERVFPVYFQSWSWSQELSPWAWVFRFIWCIKAGEYFLLTTKDRVIEEGQEIFFSPPFFLVENITFATSCNVRIYRWHFDSFSFFCRYVSESLSVRISTTQRSKIRRKWRSCNFQIETRANYWITAVPACVFSHLACSRLSVNIRRSFSTPSPTPMKAPSP